MVDKPAALCVAATIGPTRLIDNVLLTPPPKALSDRELEVVSHAIGRQDRRWGRVATVMTEAADMNSLIWALNTRLIASATATETLLAWCEEHGLSDGPITVDVRQRFAPAVVPDGVLPALGLDPGETIHYRQVRLMRGTLPLAMAENWFVPQRLTAAMTEALNRDRDSFRDRDHTAAPASVASWLRPSSRSLRSSWCRSP